MSESVISVEKVFVVNKGNVKGNILFTVGGVLSVKGTVLSGPNGDFVALPGREKYTDKNTGEEKWSNAVKFVSREVGDPLQKLLLTEYNRVAGGGAVKSTPKTVKPANPADAPF